VSLDNTVFLGADFPHYIARVQNLPLQHLRSLAMLIDRGTLEVRRANPNLERAKMRIFSSGVNQRLP
jgi:hypothetical protein